MNIENYLKKINMIEFLEKLGLQQIKLITPNITCICPFHKDKNPSLSININSGIWQCWSCKAKGGFLNLVSRLKNIGIKETLNFLYSYIGVNTNNCNSESIGNRINSLLQVFEKQDEDLEELANEFVALFPPNLIKNYEPGIKYFENRGINESTLNKFEVTFCTNGYYRGRAIIPISSECNKNVSFEARDITKIQEKKVLYPKFSKVSNCLFNIRYALHKNYVIIVEGICDAMYLSQRGFNVVSIFGTSLSTMQILLLKQYFKYIFLCFDSDKAGGDAVVDSVKKLLHFANVFNIKLPEGKDPDEIERQEFLKLLKSAKEYHTEGLLILKNNTLEKIQRIIR